MAETAKQFRNIIGGKAVDSASGETYDIVNPATGEKYATAPASGAEDVDRAMKAAEEAFETWGETTPGERQLALLKIADALESRADEFVQAECENTGKPIQLTAEEEAELAFHVTRDGRPAPVGRYLGARGHLVRNPLWFMKNDAEQTVSDLAKQLGLTPAARLRAGVVHERPPEPANEDDFPYKELWEERKRRLMALD